MSEHRDDRQTAGGYKQITSLANPLVKDLRALAMKKTRDERQLFVGEGLKLVTDALEEDWPIDMICFAAAARGQDRVMQAAAKVKARGGFVAEMTEAVLAKITRRDNPQMVVGVFKQKLTPLAKVALKENDVWVALEGIKDPGNLGTVVRTVDSVGAKGVILVGETCDPYSPEGVRATMGSLFHVPLVKCSVDEFLAFAAASPARLIGTHLKATHDYRTLASSEPTILLMGNEQAGLPDRLAEACDIRAKIPMAGRADSLNLAIATGIMLYELRRNVLTV
ncbi:23S rRNA (uridine(2479)-2'-O)-methyltransferase [Hartmannibacter diazotrophicus]|uniref:23S rRNA (Uridine(2479)-2'-O)-methyltransferase n=1 Tax=Hartmannibacter diazotrophicus TaxID=1482074 RepID=A0A2C9DD13_9HYPH|nr:RNA methyltransferase [Hartmannibacter diazotrophicus]SON58197.1 23S rRNA (uridine(2479)-2'-O)-methyltransferase [Hartmannibacter diazotrophicus]